jgi:uncharacterized membrane protein YgdD (TMEM256/DUF423 family)
MGPAAWLRIGAFAGFLAVAFGAFGAHGLRDRLKPAVSDTPEEAALKLRRIENFETASRYNMTHALALIAVGMLLLSGRPSLPLTIAGWSFVVGILLFSGSLYAYGFSGLGWLGAITPFGGLGFLIGWLALAFGAGAAVNGIIPSPVPSSSGAVPGSPHGPSG